MELRLKFGDLRTVTFVNSSESYISIDCDVSIFKSYVIFVIIFLIDCEEFNCVLVTCCICFFR